MTVNRPRRSFATRIGMLVLLLGISLAACGDEAVPPASPEVDTGAVTALDLEIRKVETFPKGAIGDTPGFSGRVENNLSQIASEYELQAQDIKAAAARPGIPSEQVAAATSLSSALESLASCLRTASADFYMSAVDRVCASAWEAVVTRREAAAS
jgi:hypothetical protein